MSSHNSPAQAAQQGNRTSDGKYTFGTHAEPAGVTLGGKPARDPQGLLVEAALDDRRQELKSAQRNTKRKQGFLNRVSGRARRAEKALSIAEKEFEDALNKANSYSNGGGK